MRVLAGCLRNPQLSLSDQIWSDVMKSTLRVPDPSSVGQTRADRWHITQMPFLIFAPILIWFFTDYFSPTIYTNGTNSSVTDEDTCSSWHCNWERVIFGGILFFRLMVGACVTQSHIYVELDWWWEHKCALLTISIYLTAYLYVGLALRFCLALKCTRAFLVPFWHGTKFCENPDVRFNFGYFGLPLCQKYPENLDVRFRGYFWPNGWS